MQFPYFYRLGHCPSLAICEFQQLTNCYDTIQERNWFFSVCPINVNKTGSLVFGGKVLPEKHSVHNLTYRGFLDCLKNNILSEQKNGNSCKKLGICIPKRLHTLLLSENNKANLKNDIIETLKKIQVKKINVIFLDEPNFGHWKDVKKWIIPIGFKGEMFFGLIQSFSNQEFWSDLDMKLPCKDMKRGIINIKLARTLVNLSTKTTVWDPFCGQGRIPASSLDIRNTFYLSDIDEVCLPEATKNLDFAQLYWSRYAKFLDLEDTRFCLPQTFFDVGDAKDFVFKDLDPTATSIVTEGYLGNTLSTELSPISAQKNLEAIENIWKKALKNYSDAKIAEVIFCLPFYKYEDKNILPKWENLLGGTAFEYYQLNTNPYILYSREKTRVGHMIFKAVRIKK